MGGIFEVKFYIFCPLIFGFLSHYTLNLVMKQKLN